MIAIEFYQMKFDVKGWDRGRYIGCITDKSFEGKSENIIKYFYCSNFICSNYLTIYKGSPRIKGAITISSLVCSDCGYEMVSCNNFSDIPKKILAGENRVSHRF